MNLKHIMPINTVGGLSLGLRSHGPHYDPHQTQRAIGGHVYIFRTLPDRIDVWRSDMADQCGGYRWTLVHRWTITHLAARKPDACPHCYSRDGHHVHCPHF